MIATTIILVIAFGALCNLMVKGVKIWLEHMERDK